MQVQAQSQAQTQVQVQVQEQAQSQVQVQVQCQTNPAATCLLQLSEEALNQTVQLRSHHVQRPGQFGVV